MNATIPARLYSIGTKRTNIQATKNDAAKSDFMQGLCINFPALPDVLTFAREAEYVVPKTQFHPDGLVHIFQSNNLLNVPVSFKLHAADDYCKTAVDLLWMAAALQAFTLPLTRGSTRLPNVPVTDRGFVIPRYEANTRQTSVGGGKLETLGGLDGMRFPAVAVLDLMMATSDTNVNSVGVRMCGYVKSVEVKLFGPWLQVSAGGIAPTAGWAGFTGTRNLPTRAEFNFTFVQAPSYRNFFNGSFKETGADASVGGDATASANGMVDTQKAKANQLANEGKISYFGQGYAEYVRDYFYNTLALFDGAALANAEAVVLDPGTNLLNAGRIL